MKKPKVAELGLFPLRDTVLFPHAIMPISERRTRPLKLLGSLSKHRPQMACVPQRNPADDAPTAQGLYETGCVARVLKAVRLNDNSVNLIIQGIRRARVERIAATRPHLMARIIEVADVVEPGVELDALVRSLTTQFQQLVEGSTDISNELGEMVLSAAAIDAARFSDLVGSVLRIKVEEKVDLLQRNNVRDRLYKLVEIVTRELELQEISKRIRARVAREVGKTQRRYFLREQRKAIERELARLLDGGGGGAGSVRATARLSLGIGRVELNIPFEMREAAWRLYVELATRVPAQAGGFDETVAGEALTLLEKLTEATRSVLKAAGPSAGTGSASLGGLAVAVIDVGVRPFLARWEPEVRYWENRRRPGSSPREHEHAWPERDRFRSELESVRDTLRGFARMLERVAGASS